MQFITLKITIQFLIILFVAIFISNSIYHLFFKSLYEEYKHKIFAFLIANSFATLTFIAIIIIYEDMIRKIIHL